MAIYNKTTRTALNHLEVLKEALGMVKSGRRNKMGRVEDYIQNIFLEIQSAILKCPN